MQFGSDYPENTTTTQGEPEKTAAHPVVDAGTAYIVEREEEIPRKLMAATLTMQSSPNFLNLISRSAELEMKVREIEGATIETPDHERYCLELTAKIMGLHDEAEGLRKTLKLFPLRVCQHIDSTFGGNAGILTHLKRAKGVVDGKVDSYRQKVREAHEKAERERLAREEAARQAQAAREEEERKAILAQQGNSTGIPPMPPAHPGMEKPVVPFPKDAEQTVPLYLQPESLFEFPSLPPTPLPETTVETSEGKMSVLPGNPEYLVQNWAQFLAWAAQQANDPAFEFPAASIFRMTKRDLTRYLKRRKIGEVPGVKIQQKTTVRRSGSGRKTQEERGEEAEGRQAQRRLEERIGGASGAGMPPGLPDDDIPF